MGRKQSLTDRLNRLNQGCCPVHGLGMGQVDGWYDEETKAPYTIVGCDRRDCGIRAKAYDINGPWELLPEFSEILDESSIALVLSEATPHRRIARRSKAKTPDIWAKTEGRCYYCGSILEMKSTFSVDHIVPRNEGGGHELANVVPCCRSCNSAKGTKRLEDFRFYRAMQRFQAQEGVFFSQDQVAYLESIGVNLRIPVHIFWFEQQLNSLAHTPSVETRMTAV